MKDHKFFIRLKIMIKVSQTFPHNSTNEKSFRKQLLKTLVKHVLPRKILGQIFSPIVLTLTIYLLY